MLASCGALLLALGACSVVSFVEWVRGADAGYCEDTEVCDVRTPLRKVHSE